ncbi:MAG: DUF2188 domain-containing protein [Candidatus Izemoplasmatales bacterium]|jgi:hypothetical protein
MGDFIKENWVFLVLVLGSLLGISLAYLIYIRVNKAKALKAGGKRVPEVKEDEEIKVSLKDLIDSEILNQNEEITPDKKLGPENNDPSDKESAHHHEEPPKPMAELVQVEVEKAAEIEPKPTSTLDAEPIDDDRNSEAKQVGSSKPKPRPVEPQKRKELGKYHVLYRKEDHKWYIKREGSDRILRVLDTQREAVAYATIKAITQDTAFVVHKQDGKIRKK